MAAARDPYDVLGVKRGAPADEIKKTYRKLAKQLHPDLHPGKPDIANRFKEVSAAYDLLSDADKRAKYDRGEIDASGNPRPEYAFRDAWGTRGAGHRGAGHRGAGHPGAGPHGEEMGFDPSEIFEEMFGRRRGRGGFRARGADVSYALEVDFLEAALGATKRITMPDGRTLDVNIPPGTGAGTVLRLKEQGSPGLGGGPPGNALIEIAVRPHKLFRREGADIHLDVPVSLQEALLGASIEVPTIDGRVSVRLPKGANTGTKLRLKGRGVAQGRGAGRGDQYVILKVMLPDPPDPVLEKFVEDWAKTHRDGKLREEPEWKK